MRAKRHDRSAIHAGRRKEDSARWPALDAAVRPVYRLLRPVLDAAVRPVYRLLRAAR
jgi:hypothetical protein